MATAQIFHFPKSLKMAKVESSQAYKSYLDERKKRHAELYNKYFRNPNTSYEA